MKETPRSFHFVPAHQKRFLAKALELPGDVLVIDLEDGVPDSEKTAARSNLRAFSRDLGRKDRDRTFVRVNAGPREYRRDLAVLEAAGISGVVLPKVRSVADFRKRLRGLAGLRPARLVPLIESFAGLASLPALFDEESLFGVGLGLEDLLAEIVPAPEDVPELVRFVKLQLVTISKAHSATCIDSVSLEFQNLTRFSRGCRESRSLGFDGMFSIHPRQIAVINREFAPSRRDREWAARVARLVGEGGGGYYRVEDEIVSPPKLRKAARILETVEEERHG